MSKLDELRKLREALKSEPDKPCPICAQHQLRIVELESVIEARRKAKREYQSRWRKKCKPGQF